MPFKFLFLPLTKISAMRKIHLVFIVLLFAFTLTAQPPTDSRLKGLDTIVAKVLKDWHAPGVSIAVVEKGKVIYTGGFGYRDMDKKLPVTENTKRQDAESPYARTKQIGEDILEDFALIHPFGNFVSLRYFNPAGAHESGLMGESPLYATLNLVPVITETAIGKRAETTVFGDDYDTRDGSCIRDYIHVMDIAHAHTLALDYVLKHKNEDNYEIFNLGTGDGVTVLEAIHAFENTTGVKFNYRIGQRRPGDVVSIYANNDKAKAKLEWSPNRTIDDIMRTAWTWEKRRSKSVLA